MIPMYVYPIYPRIPCYTGCSCSKIYGDDDDSVAPLNTWYIDEV